MTMTISSNSKRKSPLLNYATKSGSHEPFFVSQLVTYLPTRASVDHGVQLRGLRFHIYDWPGCDQTPLILVHGWGDSGLTFQFLVDHLSPMRRCIAPDMRGFGRTQWPQEGYWFPDYVADLDALIDHISPNEPVDLLGHSMGGNAALLYAGIRPQRIRKLVNVESFGLARTQPSDAPARYQRWLDQLRNGAGAYFEHESFASLERLLQKRNPRTSPDRIAFIARAWGHEVTPGCVVLRADPRHKWVNPVLYRREEAEACWRSIEAPMLFVVGEESDLVKRFADELKSEQLTSLFKRVQLNRIHGAGHMLHHEKPDALAQLVEAFLQR